MTFISNSKICIILKISTKEGQNYFCAEFFWRKGFVLSWYQCVSTHEFFYIGEDSPEHFMNASIQYCSTQLKHLSDFPFHMQTFQHLERPHPTKFPKQLAHLDVSSVFFIMHSRLHWTLPRQLLPHTSSAISTSLLLSSKVSLSSWLHCPSNQY